MNIKQIEIYRSEGIKSKPAEAFTLIKTDTDDTTYYMETYSQQMIANGMPIMCANEGIMPYNGRLVVIVV